MRVVALPAHSNELRLNWRIRWRYDPTRSTLKMEESIDAPLPSLQYQPISDVKAVKSERTSRNPIPSYVVQGTRSVSRYFSYIFMCSFSMVKFSQKLHSTYSLYFVSSNEIAFSSVVKDNKNNFLRALFFPPQKRNKQTNKTKRKRKQKNIQVLF